MGRWRRQASAVHGSAAAHLVRSSAAAEASAGPGTTDTTASTPAAAPRCAAVSSAAGTAARRRCCNPPLPTYTSSLCAAGKWGGPQPRHRATQPDGMPRAHLKCPATGLLEIATAPSPRCSTAMRWESRRSRARERRGNVGLGTAASAAAAVAILSLESAPASRPGGGMSAHGHACIVAAGCRRCRPRRPRYIYMLPTV